MFGADDTPPEAVCCVNDTPEVGATLRSFEPAKAAAFIFFNNVFARASRTLGLNSCDEAIAKNSNVSQNSDNYYQRNG